MFRTALVILLLILPAPSFAWTIHGTVVHAAKAVAHVAAKCPVLRHL